MPSVDRAQQAIPPAQPPGYRTTAPLYIVQSGGRAQMFIQPAPPPPDLAAPTVANFFPTPGAILSSSQFVSFDILDNRGMRRILVAAKYSKHAMEMIHDGEVFGREYTGTVTPIEGGYHFSVRRLHGWTSPPTIVVYAVDTSGNEV